MEILLKRHGQTEWNFLQKVQGKADIKLNEKGIKQAKDVKDNYRAILGTNQKHYRNSVSIGNTGFLLFYLTLFKTKTIYNLEISNNLVIYK